jgi:hypothetical protein
MANAPSSSLFLNKYKAKRTHSPKMTDEKEARLIPQREPDPLPHKHKESWVTWPEAWCPLPTETSWEIPKESPDYSSLPCPRPEKRKAETHFDQELLLSGMQIDFGALHTLALETEEASLEQRPSLTCMALLKERHPA